MGMGSDDYNVCVFRLECVTFEGGRFKVHIDTTCTVF